MLSNFLLVGLGGALGSMARYGLQKGYNLQYPFGTLAANLLGCLLIGLLGGWLGRQSDPQKALLLMTGFCGGFTTFSSFTLESLQLMRDGRYPALAGYALASIFGGLLLTFIGYKWTS